VGHGETAFDRVASRLAGDAHHTGHPLCDEVVARVAGVRSGLPEAGDARVDDLGRDLLDGLVVDAESLRYAGAEVLDHDIGTAHQFAEVLEALLSLEVDADAALVPVEGEECAAIVTLDGVPPVL